MSTLDQAERLGEMLAALDLDAWSRDGHLHVPGFLDPAELAALRIWAADVACLPPGVLGVLQHYERAPGRAQIARSENLIAAHEGSRSLLTEGPLPHLAGALLGEPAVLYKEKINYKLVGGAGFSAHQDAPAYKFVDVHVTARRALFCTFNARSEGDHRDAYYADKLRYFDEHRAGSVRLSTIADFQGLPPSDDELRRIGVLQ